ncbi:hypothetical protein [Micromonospora sp. DT47]|uniref:hypothetical protein n=1 Tax=Micromonospora sp. DT47 TaxID=3393431 RepID=UPI003CF92A34
MPLSAARRPRRLVILAASLALISVIGAHLAVTLRYKLDAGFFFGSPDAYARVDADNVTEHRHLARPGATIDYAFGIANPGPFTVRLQEVIDEGSGSYTHERVRMKELSREKSPSPVDLGPADAVPFRPVDLRPNAGLLVFVTLRLGQEIPPECAGFSFDVQRVRFTVLGMPREQLVPIGHVIKVEAPASDGEPCKDPGLGG